MEYPETNYAPELAYRTLHNYLTFMEQKTGCEQYVALRDKVNEEAENAGILINVKATYEVTQLINSLLGLLVIPQQQKFKKIVNKLNFDNVPVLQDKSKDNTLYNGKRDNEIDKDEKDIVQTYFRHMRNAVAHGRIEFGSRDKNGQVSHITFNDKGMSSISDRWVEFRITFSVSELEKLVIDFSRWVITH